jgi:hypothetical protein
MRRGLLLVLFVALAGGAFALSASGSDERPLIKVAKRPAAAELPPLPEMRPKVVEPVAGDAGGAAAAVEADPGLEEVGPKPTEPASVAARSRRSAGRTDITKATALSNGVALPPLEAPEEVKQIIRPATPSPARPTYGAAGTASGSTRATTAPARSRSRSRPPA